MDRITKEHRSWNMSRIRSANTAPERIVRAAVHRLGYRFRLASGQSLPGKPDIVLPKYRTVIFVHGCFWHRHRGCKFAYTPKSRRQFWLRKFKANRKRDLIVSRSLRQLGWHVVVIWECEIREGGYSSRQLVHRFKRISDTQKLSQTA
jgi:DNA mismatch endonuclease, patch repair protein